MVHLKCVPFSPTLLSTLFYQLVYFNRESKIDWKNSLKLIIGTSITFWNVLKLHSFVVWSICWKPSIIFLCVKNYYKKHKSWQNRKLMHKAVSVAPTPTPTHPNSSCLQLCPPPTPTQTCSTCCTPRCLSPAVPSSIPFTYQLLLLRDPRHVHVCPVLSSLGFEWQHSATAWSTIIVPPVSVQTHLFRSWFNGTWRQTLPCAAQRSKS